MAPIPPAWPTVKPSMRFPRDGGVKLPFYDDYITYPRYTDFVDIHNPNNVTEDAATHFHRTTGKKLEDVAIDDKDRLKLVAYTQALHAHHRKAQDAVSALFHDTYRKHVKDLSGCSLLKLSFVGVNGARTRFDGAEIAGCMFHKAKLQGASFRTVKGKACRVEHCDFTGADLRRADFSGATLAGSSFRGAVLGDGDSPSRAARFDGAEFNGTENFQGTDLRNVSFANTKICPRFDGARVDGIDLRGASYTIVSFKGATGVENIRVNHHTDIANRMYGVTWSQLKQIGEHNLKLGNFGSREVMQRWVDGMKDKVEKDPPLKLSQVEMHQEARVLALAGVCESGASLLPSAPTGLQRARGPQGRDG